MAHSDTELLTRAETAARLKISIRTLDKWKGRGKVPAFTRGRKFTRYSWPEVLAALKGEGK